MVGKIKYRRKSGWLLVHQEYEVEVLLRRQGANPSRHGWRKSD